MQTTRTRKCKVLVLVVAFALFASLLTGVARRGSGSGGAAASPDVRPDAHNPTLVAVGAARPADGLPAHERAGSSPSSSAASATTAAAHHEAPTVLSLPRAPEEVWARVQRDIAGKEPRARLMVTLDVSAVSEIDLSAAAIGRQRAAIREATDAVLGELSNVDYKVVRRYTTLPLLALDVPTAAFATIKASPHVRAAVAETFAREADVVSTPLVEAPQAWQAGVTGSDASDPPAASVAILDTGIDRNHPAFAGRIVGEACFSDATGCPNGHDMQVGSGAAAPCAAADCIHGTHVAGIAAGQFGPGLSNASGVAPRANIVAVQVFHLDSDKTTCAGFSVPCPVTSLFDYNAGLDWVFANRASLRVAAVNMSFGSDEHWTRTCGGIFDGPTFWGTRAAVQHLRDAGIASVASAGNGGEDKDGNFTGDGIGDPACIPEVVSVGDSNNDDTIAPWSQTASFLSLYAPGTGITSAVPGGGTGVLSGTSMAAPHVTGAWALAKQMMPGADVSTVLAAFQAAGVGITDTRGGLNRTTPRLRVFRGLNELSQPMREGGYVRTPNDGAVYRIAGGAPLHIDDCVKYAGCFNTANVPSLDDYNAVPADGTFIRSIDDGAIYVIAGGAPLHITDCGPIGGCPPVIPVWCLFFCVTSGTVEVSRSTIDTLDHLLPLPPDGTILDAKDTGRLYKVVGGAAVYLTACNAPGVCDGNVVAVNQATIDELGSVSGEANKHLRQFPADGTILDAHDSGRLYKVAGGAALYLTRCNRSGSCDGNVAVVNQGTIDVLGDPGANKHLRQYPADGTILNATDSNRLYKVAGGAPLYLTACNRSGVCDGSGAVVNQDTIDVLGDPGANKHLRQFPANGTILDALDTGRLYKVAGGAPLYLTACNGPGVCDGNGAGVNQDTINELGDPDANKHLRQYPADGTILNAQDSGRMYKVAGGTALYVTACTVAGACSPATIVNQGTIDVLGDPGSNKHLRVLARIGSLDAAGKFSVKEGALNAPWVVEATGVKAGIVSGNRIGIIDTAGKFSVKQGALGAPWVVEATNVKAATLSGDRIGILDTTGKFSVKQGALTAPWVVEATGVKAGIVSGDRIGVLGTAGKFSVKQGALNAQWVVEATGITAATLSGDRIGVLDTTGKFSVKQGALNAQWVTEANGIKAATLSGDRIGIIDTTGKFSVKQGALNAQWVTEANGIKAATLSGDRIGIIDTTGKFSVKQGALTAQWVTEATGVTAGALSTSVAP